MRNLKRALSLALAAIMVLGMMVIGAGAASTYENFTDKDEIQNKEAVNTMVSLGVLNGKEDGSYFDPTGIVTRGEMAKIIAVMLNGGKDPVQGSNTSTKFTDTKGNWAEPYIAFCVNQNILAGRGDGTFRPNDPVTGSAFAKAVLCALGYRADLEGMVNDLAWEMNTNVLANKVGLYDGLDSIKASEGISRDNVAQLIYNGVQADEVKYDNLYGDHSDVIQTVKNGTMLANRFGVVKVEGVVVANEVFGIDGYSSTTKGKVRLADTNTYTNSNGVATSYGAGPYPVSVPNGMMGKRIVLYVKFPNALAPNAATSLVVGEPILSEQNTVVENSAKLKNADKVKDALKGSGISVENMATSGSGSSAVTTGTKLIMIDEKGIHESYSANPGVSMIAGVQQTFIDNDNDGKVEYILQVKEALAKVSVYNTSKEELTLTGIGSIDFVDIANEGDVAKDDYVLVSKYEDTYYLTKAETVSGKVTAYDSSNDKITIDGESYTVGAGTNLAPDLDDAWQDTGANANTNFGTPGITNKETAENLKNLVDGTYTLYLDASGNVLAYTEDEAAVGNYALVTGSSRNGSAGFYTGKVRLLLADGTTGTYDVDLLASAKKWNDSVDAGTNNTTKENRMAAELNENTMAGKVVTYTLNNSTVTLGQPNYGNDKYKVIPLDVNDSKFQSSTSSYTIGGVKVMADNSTAFFVKDGNDNYSAIAGLSKLRASGITATHASAIYYNPTNSSTHVAKAIYVVTKDKYASSVDYAYIISTATKTTENNTTIYTYPVVFVDGTMDTVKSKDGNLSDGRVYSFTRDTDGYLTFGTENVVNNKLVTSSNRGAVGVTDVNNTGASDSYPVPSSAKIWNVADADVKESGSVWDTSFSRDDKVAIALDEDGNVKAGFVIDSIDTSKMTPAPTGTGLVITGSGALQDANNETVVLGVDGGSANWNKAAMGDKIQLSLNLATNQKAVISTKVGSGAATNVTKNASFANEVLYTAAAAENGTKINVTVTISDTSATNAKTDRVINYSITAYNFSEVPTEAGVTVANGAGASGIAIKGISTDADAGKKFPVTIEKAQKDNTISLGVTSAGVSKVTGVAVTGTLDESKVSKVTFKNDGTAAVVYTVGKTGEAGTLTLTVTTTETNKVPVETTYAIVIGATATRTVTILGKADQQVAVGAKLTGLGLTGNWVKIDGNYVELATYTMPDQNITIQDDGFYKVSYKTSDAAAAESYIKSYADLTLTNGVAFVDIAGTKTDVTNMGTLSADVTVTDMYKVTTDAKVAVTGGATIAVSSNDYVKVGANLTLTGDTTSTAIIKTTAGTLTDSVAGDGSSTKASAKLVMPASDVTVSQETPTP